MAEQALAAEVPADANARTSQLLAFLAHEYLGILRSLCCGLQPKMTMAAGRAYAFITVQALLT